MTCAFAAEELDFLEVREHRQGGVNAFGDELEELPDTFLLAEFIVFAILVDDLVQFLVESECLAALQKGNLYVE